MTDSANSTGRTGAGPLLALGGLALVWGYNWVVMKSALAYVGPWDFAALRGVFGVILLFGVLWAVGAPLRPRHVGKTILLGVFQTTGFVGLISWALTSGDAAALRAAITPGGRGTGAGHGAAEPPRPKDIRLTWARCLKRVFSVEIEQCVRCGGRLKVIASIEEPELVARILAHLRERGDEGAPTASLRKRAPPQATLF